MQRGRRWLLRSLADRRLAVQLLAVVLGAVFAGVAAVEYSAADGAWQEAIRQQTVRSSAVQEGARAVYADEAPEAFRIASARVRAAALRDIAATSRLAGSEWVIAKQVAFTRSDVPAPGTLADGNRYVTPAGSYDVTRRIVDATRHVALLPDPAATFSDGDRHAGTATWISVLTVVITGLAVGAASVRPRPRPRPRPRDGADPEIIPQPGAADRVVRRTSVVLLVLWAAGVLLPFAQLALGGQEQRYQAVAARTAVEIAGQVAASQARTGFTTEALQDAVTAQVAAVAREIAALDAVGPEAEAERLLAAAEERVGAAMMSIAEQMGRAPTQREGMDPAAATALASDEPDWLAAADVQAAAADRAEVFGAVSNAAVVAIAAVAALSAVVEVTAGPAAKITAARRP